MKIGITYDLKENVPVGEGEPEDTLEEYDSLETVNGIAAALEATGNSVVRLGGGKEFLEKILREKVDIVFNISEGLGTYRSREAQIPSVLEMLNIPYTGSDPQTLAVAHDKHLAKKLVSLAGVNTPRWQFIACREDLETVDWLRFPFPVFIKPAYEGSSMGVRLTSRVEKPSGLVPAVTKLIDSYKQPVLVEEFIHGDEVTVGLTGNSPPQILGIMRVLPKKEMPYFVYSLEIKKDWENLVDYECPARLPEKTIDKISDLAVKVFKTLDCRDFARIDFRVSSDGEPYFLEINPLPGLNFKNSDFPIMAYKMRWVYNALIAEILKAAVKRYTDASFGNLSL